MNIAIFGLGYVGCVSMACFARENHQVFGIDSNSRKVDLIKQGKSPIIEPGLEEIIGEFIAKGNIIPTQDVSFAINHSDILFICVGTPSKTNGSLELKYIERVCREIGQFLKTKDGFTIVVVRSTILPGIAQTNLIPILEEESGKVIGKDIGFCLNPEFLREGSAINDFYYPPFTIIGTKDDFSGKELSKLYQQIDAPIYQVPLGAAEMIKYASNAFHAMKITFANEIGNICQANGVDSHLVMDIFARDENLNISNKYLKPGYAFGGSCLGKDLRAMLYHAQQKDLKLPVLSSILPSNRMQINKAVEMVVQNGKRRIGLIGLSFKPNTDDLRESPSVEFAEQLIGKGYELSIYDHEVNLSKLYGSNRQYLESVLPHINTLMSQSLEGIVKSSDVIVIAKSLRQEEQKKLTELLHPNHLIIDLVRIDEFYNNIGSDYLGICW